MSSSCRYAAAIIARCIAVARKPRGGKRPESIRSSMRATLWLKTHPLPTSAAQIDSEGATSSVAVTTNQKARKHRRPIIKQEPNDETKPISAAGPQ